MPSDDHSEGHRDVPESSHLDLLLNAIQGSDADESARAEHQGGVEEERHGDFSFDKLLGLPQGEESDGQALTISHKRQRHDEGNERRDKFTRLLEVGNNHASNLEPCADHAMSTIRAEVVISKSKLSTIEVWHPKTAQKSYKKERRILNPPPTLRVTGPLSLDLTSATLATVALHPEDPSGTDYSHQTHRIPLFDLDPLDLSDLADLMPRRAAREAQKRRLEYAAIRAGYAAGLSLTRAKNTAQEREALRSGLTFPSLWVAEEIGKQKEFRLELRLGTSQSEQPQLGDLFQAQRSMNVGEHIGLIDTTSLRDIVYEPDDQGNLNDLVGEPGLANITESKNPELVNGSDDMGSDAKAARHGIEEAILGEASPLPTSNTEPVSAPWATLQSSSLSVVSKPPQKTAKTRSLANCLTEDDAVSLFVRINSQTVRTKYMKLESSRSPQLTAKTGKWSPFRFEVLHRTTTPVSNIASSSNRKTQTELNQSVLSYGSVVRLHDLHSGVRTEPLKLVKIDRNQVLVGADDGQPVSELQRVGFVRAESEVSVPLRQGRCYLAAPGARLGGVERTGRNRSRGADVTEVYPTGTPPAFVSPDREHAIGGMPDEADTGQVDHEISFRDIDDVIPAEPQLRSASRSVFDTADLTTEEPDRSPWPGRRKVKTKRLALAKIAATEDDDNNIHALLSWARASEAVQSEVTAEHDRLSNNFVERVEDWMCWIITGVSSFSYSLYTETPDDQQPSRASPGILPRLLTEPSMPGDRHILQLTIGDFHFQHDGQIRPCDVHLGPLGPLKISLWRSTAPSDKGVLPTMRQALPYEEGGANTGDVIVRSAYPAAMPHVIVAVNLPDPKIILEVLRKQTKKTQNTEEQVPDEQVSDPILITSPSEHVHQPIWIAEAPESEPAALRRHLDTVAELTIQQALQNATDAQNEEMQSIVNEFDPVAGPSTDSLDPSLIMESEGTSGPVPPHDIVQDIDQNDGMDVLTDLSPLPVRLETVPKDNGQNDHPSLPLLLVRPTDGMVFSLGRGIAVKGLTGGHQPSLERDIQLQVVNS